tara:strand:+ start:3766 stop:4143 length:378 start_codon:yes stop_codon:yes gene_type:complete
MRLKTYTQYLTETAQLTSIKAGEESKVEISDQKTADGKVISAQEILGQIMTAQTEDEFKAFFYQKYGSTKFDTATMGQMITNYQDYYKEQAAEEEEKEKEEKKGGGDGGGGDEGGGDDPLADLGI